jgi:hypothetical protein
MRIERLDALPTKNGFFAAFFLSCRLSHSAFAIRAGLRDNCLSKQHSIPASGVQARGKTLVN